MKALTTIPYLFKGNTVTTIVDENNDPWFVAKDVCAVLDTRTKDIRSILDEDEFITVDSIDLGLTTGSRRILLSESGLYSLILRSRKPQAKAFKKWVTAEVLPSIRKHGGYIHARPEETDDEIMAKLRPVPEEPRSDLPGPPRCARRWLLPSTRVPHRRIG